MTRATLLILVVVLVATLVVESLSMTRASLLILVVVLVAPLVVESLRCMPCGTYECQVLDPPCKYGEVTDVCNCCPACAKGPGEECGGPWNTAGKCQEGLTCVKPELVEIDFNARGNCTTVNTSSVGSGQDIDFKGSQTCPDAIDQCSLMPKCGAHINPYTIASWMLQIEP